MRNYILKRILTGVIVLIMVSIIVFTIIQLLPGNPYANMISPNMSQADVETMLRKIGYYDAIYIKYFKWAGRALTGDFGYSIQYGKPVMEIILSKIGNSAILAGFAMALSLAISIPLGVFTAIKRNSVIDYIITFISFIAISIPSFFFALVLIKIFGIGINFNGINTQILPANDMKTITANYTGIDNVKDILRHMILPGITLATAQSAIVLRYLKNSMIEIIDMDYIRTAMGKGMSYKKAVWTHGLKNASIPIITILFMQIPTIFSGSLITETIFLWPGIGKLNYDAIMNRDYPIVMGVLMFIAFIVLISNLVADLLYVLIDKRIKY